MSNPTLDQATQAHIGRKLQAMYGAIHDVPPTDLLGLVDELEAVGELEDLELELGVGAYMAETRFSAQPAAV